MGKACVAIHGSDYPGQTVACRHGLLGPCLYCHQAAMLAHLDAVHHVRRPIDLDLEVADDFVRPQSVVAADSTPEPAKDAA